MAVDAPQRIAVPQRIAFLKRIHLFRGLSDEQLSAIATKVQEVPAGAKEVLVREGDRADSFFLLYSGKVRITHRLRKGERQLAVLVSGDYFGEEALIVNRRRTATVSVMDEAVLLKLAKRDFDSLLKQIPKLKPNFELSVSSRKLSRRLKFKWLHEDEVIYFLARKHPILLYRTLTGPFFAMVFILILLLVNLTLFKIEPLSWLTGFLMLPIFIWGAWNGVDWGNDYYIVTNQRVIWLEKVVGIYDSRQEAPLSTVVSVGVETDAVGRILDYGDVIVRTFVGRIPFHHVNHPSQAAALVEEQWGRTKEFSRKAEEGAMRRAIRERLYPDKTPPPQPPAPAKPAKPSRGQMLFSNFLKLRFENVSTITYRKHWFVLFKQVWLASLVWLLQVALLIYEVLSIKAPIRSILSNLGTDTLIALWILIFFIITLWWIYQYVDWSNDIYQVTPEQILDIDKTPFGRETRKAAPLDNILSTEYKRVGMVGMFFNYGTVYITVGGTQLDFSDVFNPAGVQDDIDRRRMSRLAKKREAEVATERERMADWFAAYHHSSEELQKAEQEKKAGEAGSEPETA